uniref:Uncharacterized protein n=1 Tax=Anopheles funestus TaxID=62324 RepID=A0A182RPM7_ANOFN
MDLRSRNLSTITRVTRDRTGKKSTASRPSSVSMARSFKHSTELPIGSSSLTKIHPLGTIPKYLQKQKLKNASASSSVVQEPMLVEIVEPPTEQLQTVPTISEAQLEAEYKQQTIDRLERQVQELLVELGYREQRIRELHANLYSAQQTLGQMQTMMQSHLKAQQPIVKKITKESKALLLLQMILDSQSCGQGAAKEQDRAPRYL